MIDALVTGVVGFVGIIVGCVIAGRKRKDGLLKYSADLVELHDDKLKKYEHDGNYPAILDDLDLLLSYRKNDIMDKDVFHNAYSNVMKRFAQNEGALRYIINCRTEHPDEDLFDCIYDYWKELGIKIKI
ncbi:MAG: hypothetical protein EB828_04525 [Nitrosopumilus sp. D6]|nr:MAG: hypothetical protein EB828_04525 [Nitrosopumilus sp. D6]